MRHLRTVTAVSMLAMGAALASAADAGAVTPQQLEKNGSWICIAPEPLTPEPHCVKPRALTAAFSGTAETFTMRVFDLTGQFLGTEFNIRGDLFHNQPCPTDPPSYKYTWLYPVFGIDYWACHRFDSDHV